MAKRQDGMTLPIVLNRDNYKKMTLMGFGRKFGPARNILVAYYDTSGDVPIEVSAMI
jgi:hypothetical protein